MRQIVVLFCIHLSLCANIFAITVPKSSALISGLNKLQQFGTTSTNSPPAHIVATASTQNQNIDNSVSSSVTIKQQQPLIANGNQQQVDEYQLVAAVDNINEQQQQGISGKLSSAMAVRLNKVLSSISLKTRAAQQKAKLQQQQQLQQQLNQLQQQQLHLQVQQQQLQQVANAVAAADTKRQVQLQQKTIPDVRNEFDKQPKLPEAQTNKQVCLNCSVAFVSSIGNQATRFNVNRKHNQQSATVDVSSQSNSNRNPVMTLNIPSSSKQTNAGHYSGYSLIELDIRTATERAFVESMYASSLTGTTGADSLDSKSASMNQNFVLSASDTQPDVDFWSFGHMASGNSMGSNLATTGSQQLVDVMVSPKARGKIIGQLNKAKIKHRITIEDIQAKLDAFDATTPNSSNGSLEALASSPKPSLPSLPSPSDTLRGRHVLSWPSLAASSDELGVQLGNNSYEQPNNNFFDNYQRLSDINAYLEKIVDNNRDVAEIKIIGRSSQGRHLRVLKLGYSEQIDTTTISTPVRQSATSASLVDAFLKSRASTRKEGAIWIDGGTHAREWISPATALYIAFRLSENHGNCRRFYSTLRSRFDLDSSLSSSSSLRFAKSLPIDEELTDNDEQDQLLSYSQASADLNNNSNNISTDDTDISINSIETNSQDPTNATAFKELERIAQTIATKPQVLASEFGCELEVDELLRKYTFYIEPVLNPDGYEFSHTSNRLWRKTRSQNAHPIYRHFCLGADPNRNYDTRHGATGSSSHPCSQTYAGATPFTEPETKHQSNFVYANRQQFKMFISLHSYSQVILLPFSHSLQQAPDHADLESVGLAGAKAIEKTHGTTYRVGASAAVLYTASGTASDWAYEKAGIKYSYTIELRDTGNFGFLLPRQQIIPTGEETLNGLLAMISQMQKNENLLTSKSQSISANDLQNSNDISNARKDQNSPIVATQNTELTNDIAKSEAELAQPQLDKRLLHAPSNEAALAGAKWKLENVLDGSNSWSAPSFGLSNLVGAKDRKPSQIDDNNKQELSNPLEEPPIDGEFALELDGSDPNRLREVKRAIARMSGTSGIGQSHSSRIAATSELSHLGRNLINSARHSDIRRDNNNSSGILRYNNHFKYPINNNIDSNLPRRESSAKLRNNNFIL